MGYSHVEDSQVAPSKKVFLGRNGIKPTLDASTATVKLSVYRCDSCRALAVTQHGDPVPRGPCGRCKR